MFMDMDQSATFLAASILTMLGFIVICIGIVVINNILSKYWKPITWGGAFDVFHIPQRFAEPHEVEKINEPTLKKSRSLKS
jgi:hypothetical protein